VKKESVRISAHEVNKFTYCPHQWYYERVYGAKAIRAKYRERNERLGLEDAAGASFVKGLLFHGGYGARPWWVWVWRGLVLAVAAVAAVALWLVISQGGF